MLQLARTPPAAMELIGLRCRVLAPPERAVQGTVVDETRGTLTLEVGAREVVVPKRGQVFEFTLPDGSQQRLEGSELGHRPEDRIRKARSK